MSRHAIDEAMLRAARPADSTVVESETVLVDSPYASAKAALLSVVAEANGCRMVVKGAPSGARRCVLVGHSSNLGNTRSMFTALSLHATREMLGAAVPLHDSPRRFRYAFLLAFACRIGERLRESTEAARCDAQRATGHSVAVVLMRQSAAVDQAIAAQFPHLRTTRPQASSRAGIVSGRGAADRAGLGPALHGGGSAIEKA